MKKNKKKQRQQIHFKNSCIKRLGEVLDEKAIIESIQNNELEFISRQSNRITKWKYIYDNNEYMIIYDKDRKQVVTIIPYKDNSESANNELYWWILSNKSVY